MRIPIKSRRKWILSLIILISIFTVFTLNEALSQSPPPQTSVGSNWETVCGENGICQTTIFSYQKYWINENGDWEFLNESFDTINCEINYDFCVDRNLYQVHAKEFPDTAETIKYIRNSSTFRFQPFTLNYRNSLGQLQQISTIQNTPISVNHNQISYPNAFVQGTNLNYVYLPRTLKQELVIADNLTLPEPEGYILEGEDVTLDIDFQIGIDSDIDIWINGEIWNQPPYQDVVTSDPVYFKRGEETLFLLPKPVAFDTQGDFVLLKYEFKKQGNTLYTILKTPYEWLTGNFTFFDGETNETIIVPREYPIFIDPTVALNFTAEIWDGYITNTSGTYKRNNNPKMISIGKFNSTLEHRGGIHWNISAIPDNANILELNLSLHIDDVICDRICFTEVIMKTRNMEGDETTYPNNATGNEQFFDDMGNGTIYNSHTFTVGFSGNVNLSMSSQGKSDFENSLSEDEFSFGFKASASRITIKLRGKSDSTASMRPKLIIIWGVNETDGDQAIEQGIQNALGSPLIYTDQKIHLLNENDDQFLGSFDKATQQGNQTWAFNYVTGNETFTNIPSLFTILNVWENQSLTSSQITSQVETFINFTKE